MPVSEKEVIPSSLLEVDPLLRDLYDKKMSLKRKVTSMAVELRDVRNKLASQELLFARESETRKVAELKARNLEEEVSKLQKCLQNKEEQLRSLLCSTKQELAGLRSQLSVIQATAESTAASAQSAQLHCSSLLGKLNDKNHSPSEHELLLNHVAEQFDNLQRYLEDRAPSLVQLNDYSLGTDADITDAFVEAGFDNANELLKIMSGVSEKNSENKDSILENDGTARLRESVSVLSSSWRSKITKLELQLGKNWRTVKELKRRVLKLEFCLQEPRSRLQKLQRIRKKRDEALALTGLRSQLAVEKLIDGCSGNKHHIWESSAFKFIASMSMVALVTLAKR